MQQFPRVGSRALYLRYRVSEAAPLASCVPSVGRSGISVEYPAGNLSILLYIFVTIPYHIIFTRLSDGCNGMQRIYSTRTVWKLRGLFSTHERFIRNLKEYWIVIVGFLRISRFNLIDCLCGVSMFHVVHGLMGLMGPRHASRPLRYGTRRVLVGRR